MKIREIISSGQAPSSPQDLWLGRGSLKYFSGSGWKAINASGIPPPADDEDRQELEEKVDSLDKEMGEVKQSISNIEQYFSPSVFLSIGDSDEVKASNLAALSPISVGDPFQCEINYGFGVGRMSSSGGFAHVTTSEGYEAFYDISTDGAVTKNSTYVKPNEPLQVVLSVEDLESAVDDTTSAAIQKAALIVIVDEEGKSTVCTRIMNDSSPNPSFFVPSSDNTLMRLTFNITSKTFSSSEYKPNINLVAATVDTLGAVKQADRVNDLSVSAELADVVTAFNSLLSKLITAGIMVQKPT